MEIFRFEERQMVDYKGKIYQIIDRVSVDYDKKYLLANGIEEPFYADEWEISSLDD